MASPDVFKKVCEKNSWACQGDKAEILLPGERRQMIYMQLFQHEGEEMVRFYTNVGGASALSQTRLKAALSLNFKIPHGALAIHDDHLVMSDTFLLREADQDEVEASIRYLAETADRYERMIYGTDDH